MQKFKDNLKIILRANILKIILRVLEEFNTNFYKMKESIAFKRKLMKLRRKEKFRNSSLIS